MNSVEFINSHESPVPGLSNMSQDDSDLFTAKIILIGDSTVGKTSIIFQYLNDRFLNDPVLTIGLELTPKKIKLDKESINLQIWDSAGQERYRTFTYHFYRGISGVMLVFDLGNLRSLENIEFWIKQIRNHAPENVSIVLIGNKCEIEKKEIDDEKIKNMSNKYQFKYFECSAKSGKNINEAFKYLAQLICNKINSDGKGKHGGPKNMGDTVIKLTPTTVQRSKSNSTRDKQKKNSNPCCD